MRKLQLWQGIIFFVILLFPTLVSAYHPVVKADQSYYDYKTGLHMLEGNVIVRVKDAEIRAPMARVSLANLEVYAEGGISVIQGDTCFRGDSVFVKAKERLAVITGNITLEDNGISFAGTKADFNWKTKDVTLTNVTITDNSGSRYVDWAVYNIRSKTLTY